MSLGARFLPLHPEPWEPGPPNSALTGRKSPSRKFGLRSCWLIPVGGSPAGRVPGAGGRAGLAGPCRWWCWCAGLAGGRAGAGGGVRMSGAAPRLIGDADECAAVGRFRRSMSQGYEIDLSVFRDFHDLGVLSAVRAEKSPRSRKLACREVPFVPSAARRACQGGRRGSRRSAPPRISQQDLTIVNGWRMVPAAGRAVAPFAAVAATSAMATAPPRSAPRLTALHQAPQCFDHACLPAADRRAGRLMPSAFNEDHFYRSGPEPFVPQLAARRPLAYLRWPTPSGIRPAP